MRLTSLTVRLSARLVLWPLWGRSAYPAFLRGVMIIINAIGGEQKHCDYRTSMKCQRDRCTMEMGPLLQAIADGDTVAFVYEMYLTPKGMENAPTFTMMATEFNHFKMVGEKLIVTRLDLYTDGGKMN